MNRLHSGLKKRRALSVQEVFTGSNQQPSQQPTFYVPSPLHCDRVPSHEYKSLPDYDSDQPTSHRAKLNAKEDKDRRGRIIHSCSFDVIESGRGRKQASDVGYHSIDSNTSLDEVDTTVANNKDLDRSASFRTAPEEPKPDYDDDVRSSRKHISMRRWSVTNGLSYGNLPSSFRVGEGSKVRPFFLVYVQIPKCQSRFNHNTYFI